MIIYYKEIEMVKFEVVRNCYSESNTIHWLLSSHKQQPQRVPLHYEIVFETSTSDLNDSGSVTARSERTFLFSMMLPCASRLMKALYDTPYMRVAALMR